MINDVKYKAENKINGTTILFRIDGVMEMRTINSFDLLEMIADGKAFKL